MKTVPQPVAERIAKLILLLGSDKDGEIVATAHAIRRTAAGVGCDLHDVAGLMTGGTSIDIPFPESPPQPKPHPRGWPNYSWRSWQSPDPMREARDEVRRCQAAYARLSAWEREFVASLARTLAQGRTLSSKQTIILADLAEKVSA